MFITYVSPNEIFFFCRMKKIQQGMEELASRAQPNSQQPSLARSLYLFIFSKPNGSCRVPNAIFWIDWAPALCKAGRQKIELVEFPSEITKLAG